MDAWKVHISLARFMISTKKRPGRTTLLQHPLPGRFSENPRESRHTSSAAEFLSQGGTTNIHGLPLQYHSSSVYELVEDEEKRSIVMPSVFSLVHTAQPTPCP
ncbi:hypothetical protein N7G274_004104 [Stereocaulon virgatum]|uniref:Uncharacterized protein n=1 Tax=Stereocaulon virgatum TaxID=373712 RepID=A0ABR4AC10_9LECA